MKSLLVARDGTLDLGQPLPWNYQDLTQDLAVDMLLDAMAAGDALVRRAAQCALFRSLQDVDAILYRQRVLQDCLAHPEVLSELHRIARAAVDAERQNYWTFSSQYASSPTVYGLVSVVENFVEPLAQLRRLADTHWQGFKSEAFQALFAWLRNELDDAYLASVRQCLKQLHFRGGVLVSAGLGDGNRGAAWRLLHPPEAAAWWQRMLALQAEGFSFELDPRDELGLKTLANLEQRGMSLAAQAVMEAAQHLLAFFVMLQTETAFYVGCLNLHRRLSATGVPLCFPVPLPAERWGHSFRNLHDPCLALSSTTVVSNDFDGDQRRLVVITGANQGGKTTFLRSVGLAQLMLQCGMFVAASEAAASVCRAVATHYKREEDATLKSGKFEEELLRMNALVEHLVPGTLLLFNESLAATNEREGSEIARQIVLALVEKGMKVWFVTHLYDFASSLYQQGNPNTRFLRAERRPDGQRTFRICPGQPLETSYGRDLYERIFAVPVEQSLASMPLRVSRPPPDPADVGPVSPEV